MGDNPAVDILVVDSLAEGILAAGMHLVGGILVVVARQSRDLDLAAGLGCSSRVRHLVLGMRLVVAGRGLVGDLLVAPVGLLAVAQQYVLACLVLE